MTGSDRDRPSMSHKLAVLTVALFWVACGGNNGGGNDASHTDARGDRGSIGTDVLRTDASGGNIDSGGNGGGNDGSSSTIDSGGNGGGNGSGSGSGGGVGFRWFSPEVANPANLGWICSKPPDLLDARGAFSAAFSGASPAKSGIA